MSNVEDNKDKNISREQAKTMDDIFGVKKIDLEGAMGGHTVDIPQSSLESIQAEFEGKQQPIQVQATQAKFQPKVAPKSQVQLATSVQQPPKVEVPETDEVTPQRLKALEEQIQQLTKGQNGVKVTKAPVKPAPLDFSKLSEEDVFDLEIPIEAIDHGVPDYLSAELKDKNYATRWVHKTPRRLGPMLAVGWQYVTEEDLENVSSLIVTKDENGQFRFDDVILMKCLKSKYFAQLRRNHERALMQVNPKIHHQLAKKAVEGALQSNSSGGNKPGKSAREYMNEGKLEVYEPLAK